MLSIWTGIWTSCRLLSATPKTAVVRRLSSYSIRIIFTFWSIRQQRQNCWIAWLEREELGQTNLNNILAIPHPMSLIAFKSVVPVAMIPNGIDWGDGHLVKFVFLFSIAKEDYANTEYIYDLLLELMDQNRKQEHILSNHYFEYLSNFRHEELKITMIATHITFSNFIKKHKHQWKSMYFSWRIKHYWFPVVIITHYKHFLIELTDTDCILFPSCPMDRKEPVLSL